MYAYARDYIKSKFYEWAHYFETYVFADWQFLNFLLVLVLINGMLNLYSSYKSKQLNYKLFGWFLQKIFVYTCFMVLVHSLSHFTIEGEKNNFFGWFNGLAYSALMIRESIYILDTMATIRPGLIPGWILNKLKQYDKDGYLQTHPSEKRPE